MPRGKLQGSRRLKGEAGRKRVPLGLSYRQYMSVGKGNCMPRSRWRACIRTVSRSVEESAETRNTGLVGS